MKRIIFPQKEHAELEETGSPLPEPEAHEVTVQSIGCGICQVEIKSYKGQLGGSFPETRLGHESIGRVTKIGRDVKRLKEGEFVTTLWAPGFQEFFNVREDWAIAVPEPQPGQESSWISEPASCALNGLISADVQPGERVLLLGAGYMGLLLTQIFTRTPCAEFVVCDRIESKLEHALKLGATSVINGAKMDVFEEATRSGGFDVVIEATGAANMIARSILASKHGGRVIVFADHRHHRSEEMDWEPFIAKGVSLLPANPSSHPDFPEVWRKSVALLKAGIFDQRTLITHQWPVEECREAMATSANPPEDYIKGYFSWI